MRRSIKSYLVIMASVKLPKDKSSAVMKKKERRDFFKQ